MMGKKERNSSPLPRDVSLEDLVPEGNFYRRPPGRARWRSHRRPVAVGRQLHGPDPLSQRSTFFR